MKEQEILEVIEKLEKEIVKLKELVGELQAGSIHYHYYYYYYPYPYYQTPLIKEYAPSWQVDLPFFVPNTDTSGRPIT